MTNYACTEPSENRSSPPSSLHKGSACCQRGITLELFHRCLNFRKWVAIRIVLYLLLYLLSFFIGTHFTSFTMLLEFVPRGHTLALTFCFFSLYCFFLPDEVCRCTRNVVPFYLMRCADVHETLSLFTWWGVQVCTKRCPFFPDEVCRYTRNVVPFYLMRCADVHEPLSLWFDENLYLFYKHITGIEMYYLLTTWI